MARALKIILIVAGVIAATIGAAVATFYILTSGVKLSEDKLINYANAITVYDDEGNRLETASLTAKRKSVNIGELSDDTLHAFIASEDHTFYKHGGLNYKRMLKALYKNVTSRSFKEGASTISQQLVKNTHLSNDKTIMRKLKEIRLTRQLERKYSKDEILEMYLNTIYFGHNCYGLQSAANFYFDENAEALTLEQSATIVGLLTSPNNYSPFRNPEKCLQRRNSVLKSMKECGYIDNKRLEEESAKPLSATYITDKEKYSDYLSAVFDELDGIRASAYGDLAGCKVYTYLNTERQNVLESLSFDSDESVIIRDRNGGVTAFLSSIGEAKRQIGSTAKPIFVYAPALEEKKIDLYTKIKDEKVDFNGYSPENYDKKYRGDVTVEESIMQSLNVPAVKTLNTLSLSACERYALKMGIKLEDGEKNLSLALGAMNEGLSLKSLCDCYSVFSNGGNFVPSSFIKEIVGADGKRIYRDEKQSVNVFSKGTCSLINDVLCKTGKSGTARKLKGFNFDVACKTGTCGNSDGNTDAYSVAYTSDLTLGVWLGNKDNKRTTLTGGADACGYVKEILSAVYDESTPAPLDKESGTVTIEIDREDYERDGKVTLADSAAPQYLKVSVKCLSGNEPKNESTKFSHPEIRKPQINVVNNTVTIKLYQTEYYSYVIKRQQNGNSDEIYNGKWKEKIEDEPTAGSYTYTVTPVYNDGRKEYIGKSVTLPQVIIKGDDGNGREQKENDNVPDIAYKDWENM